MCVSTIINRCETKHSLSVYAAVCGLRRCTAEMLLTLKDSGGQLRIKASSATPPAVLYLAGMRWLAAIAEPRSDLVSRCTETRFHELLTF